MNKSNEPRRGRTSSLILTIAVLVTGGLIGASSGLYVAASSLPQPSEDTVLEDGVIVPTLDFPTFNSGLRVAPVNPKDHAVTAQEIQPTVRADRLQ